MKRIKLTIDFAVPDDADDDIVTDLGVDAFVQIEDGRTRDGGRLPFDVSVAAWTMTATDDDERVRTLIEP